MKVGDYGQMDHQRHGRRECDQLPESTASDLLAKLLRITDWYIFPRDHENLDVTSDGTNRLPAFRTFGDHMAFVPDLISSWSADTPDGVRLDHTASCGSNAVGRIPHMAPSSPYHRVLLKISGESFCKPGEMGIAPDSLSHIAAEIVEAARSGVQIAVVTGGGNMIRGAELSAKLAIDQSTTDYMGMLGTVMNGMALKERLEQLGQPARLMSAIDLPALAESFVRKRALRHFEKGRIVILAAGTGNPFFTTDTCASLRATELNCDVLLKGTKVDGIYSEDPNKNPDATKYDTLTFREAVDQQLGVMDITALSMCMEQDLPIVVFNYQTAGNIRKVVEGDQIGTIVSRNGSRQTAAT